jgi:uncharacterized membrane protein YidH (DUF202 family)
LPALERTFIAYFHTSITFAFLGVLVTQLYTILNESDAKTGLGFHNIGIPISCLCHVIAMAIPILGACRFFRQQSVLARGKVHAGGWELNAIGAFSALVS